MPNERYTYNDYLTWNKEYSWELIDGVPLAMSPAPSRLHQEISGELFFRIKSYLQDKKCKIYAAPFDVRLTKKNNAKDNEITNVVQPDLTIICNEDYLDDRGAKGVPDFIIEIVSPSSTFLDYVKKLNLYGEHGVAEYWIVNPMKKNVMVYTISESSQYGMPAFYSFSNTITVGIFPDLVIDFSTIM